VLVAALEVEEGTRSTPGVNDVVGVIHVRIVLVDVLAVLGVFDLNRKV
jgi:hypothetical protein